MAFAHVRLGKVLESVEAEVVVGMTHFRLVVVENILREHFGADETPQSWIDAFQCNANEIERAALAHFSSRGGSTVVLCQLGVEQPAH